MTAAFEDQILVADLHKEFGCEYQYLGVGKVDATLVGKRAKIDKIHQYFRESYPNAATKQQAVQSVREKWTAGLGPVESWLMWMAIRFLARQVVSWLWERYNK